MAEKPRIRLPKRVKKGEIIPIRTLVSHAMESSQRRDASGNLISRKLINGFACTFNG